MSQVTAAEDLKGNEKGAADLLFYLEEPIVYKDEIIGSYTITEESMVFRFERGVDVDHLAIKSFLIKHTLLATKQFYHGFDFQLLFSGRKVIGIICTPLFDPFVRSRFIERLAWAISKAMSPTGARGDSVHDGRA